MTSVVPYRPGDQPVALEARHRWVVLLSEAAQLAHAIANTEFVPKAMRGNEAVIAAAILYGDEIGLPPMQALAKIAVIDGKPSVSAEGQRALIQAAGHSLRGEGTTTKFTWWGRRADTGDEMTFTWTADDAKRAGIAGKQNWRLYPRAMLSARASAELAKALFADVIGGLSATEELEDLGSDGAGIAPTPPDSDPQSSDAGSKTTRRRRPPPSTMPPPVVAPQMPSPAAPPEPPLPGEEPEPPKPSQTQMNKLMAMFAERGMADRDDRLDWANKNLERTIISASELTAGEASDLIDALERVPPISEPDLPESAEEPDDAQLEIGDVDNPRVTSERLDVLMFLWREAGVGHEWMGAKLAELGHTGLPRRITREHLGRLTRSEAMVLSDALSTEVDQRGPRGD